jgi:hypothetical protein
MEDGIAISKAKGWFLMLDDVNKIAFMEWLWKSEKHKMEYAKMDTGTRKFFTSGPRPTHQEE